MQQAIDDLVECFRTHVLLDELLQEEGYQRLQRLGHKAVVHLRRVPVIDVLQTPQQPSTHILRDVPQLCLPATANLT